MKRGPYVDLSLYELVCALYSLNLMETLIIQFIVYSIYRKFRCIFVEFVHLNDKMSNKMCDLKLQILFFVFVFSLFFPLQFRSDTLIYDQFVSTHSKNVKEYCMLVVQCC